MPPTLRGRADSINIGFIEPGASFRYIDGMLNKILIIFGALPFIIKGIVIGAVLFVLGSFLFFQMEAFDMITEHLEDSFDESDYDDDDYDDGDYAYDDY